MRALRLSGLPTHVTLQPMTSVRALLVAWREAALMTCLRHAPPALHR